MVQSDPNNKSARFSQAIATYKVSFSLAEIDANAAAEMARESVRLFDELKTVNPSFLVVSRRAIALGRLAGAEYKAGHLDEAWRWSRAAVQAQQSIPPQGADVTEEKMQLVQELILAGKISAASRQPERAEAFFQQAIDQATSIARSQEIIRLIPLADAEEALGSFYAARHKKAEARACYQKVAGLWQPFPDSNEYAIRRRAATAKLLASSLKAGN
jgi:tetratricopeptide (TPR) repeat protein